MISHGALYGAVLVKYPLMTYGQKVSLINLFYNVKCDFKSNTVLKFHLTEAV